MKNIGILALIVFSGISSWMLFSTLSVEKLLFSLALISVGLALTFAFEKNKVTGTAMLCVGLAAVCASLGFIFQFVL